ncbi:MAG: 3-dehydroquinate synthase [Lachnospiraceae bacterium]|nr:3-dehydroquinate synthase [Lachnospiraceae bacterium]
MEQITIERKGAEIDFSYHIVWEHGFDHLPDCLSAAGLPFQKVCIITDTNVEKLYLDQVKQALAPMNKKVFSYVLPAGEEHKNLNEIQKIYGFLIREHFERKDLLIALGGGVVGDMTGFTAATYLRGVDFVQIPTTLLSQVDSSVGGKTGVDYDAYKNMVGAFYQPRLVYMNTDVLKSLPDDQFASGMGEVLKSGLIRNREFYEWIDAYTEEILEKDAKTLDHMVQECCKIKAKVVEEDPKENGVRAILNFGHTLGHAVEKLKNFTMLHGHCVGFGTVAAAWMSYQKGLIPKEDLDLILRLNETFSLPSQVSDLSVEEIITATKSDKKMEGGHIRFILLNGIGNAVIDRSISDEEMRSALQEFMSGEKTPASAGDVQ